MILFNIIKRLLALVFRALKLVIIQEKWRAQNSHNSTEIQSIVALDNIKVGRMTYGPIEILRWNSKGEALTIGNFCSIASGVKFILGGNHDSDTISTFPFAFFYGKIPVVATTKGPIVVEDDVWIGTDATIMSGLTIGKGAIIAAGSVVTRDVPPYSIVGGCPAKVLKYRFDRHDMENVVKLNYSNLSDELILNNLPLWNKSVKSIDNSLLEKIIDKTNHTS